MPAGMVRLMVALQASSTSLAQELLEAFRFLGLSTRLEPGCLGCSSWADPEWTVRYVEEWATEEDMRRRVQSESFTSLLAVMESAERPEVQFDFVTKTRGLDYIEEARAELAGDENRGPRDR